MTAPRSHDWPRPAVCAAIVAVMLAMLVLPAALTLHSVRAPSLPVFSTDNPTPNPSPYGYTWSLLLFLVPIGVLGLWFGWHGELEIRRAFWWTIAFLGIAGCLLDIIFAQWFFRFPNAGAIVGVHAPAIGKWVPVEEYLFYFSGFLMILLVYVWLSENWLAAYTEPNYRAESAKIAKLLRFHWTSLVVGVVLIAVAVLYKKEFSEVREGWPGYFMVLVIGGLIPSIGFFDEVQRFINWRAFSLTMLFTMLISLLWEATLALPYGWWGYERERMLGIFIGAWDGLPIEAVLVWIAVTYGTVIVFEVIKLQQASGRPAREALLGGRAAAPGRQG